MKLVLATLNPGKIAELKTLLAGLPLALVPLAAYPEYSPPEETGRTLEENAALKAEAVARFTGLWALADDSGLEVDALGGRPGVFSARYAGEDADDKKNNAKLLIELAGVAASERTARFRTVIALAHPGQPTRFAEGVCEGLIALEPRGESGFGYDPLFYYPPAGKTFAEMLPAEKNKISHRAKALQAARELLQQLAGM
ncbi:MAG: XTP/dITP diphosphatase [Firmicutes bacterium]|jgi:XTP/dITP diphosphohydrolase|nr:XTP/dITP diphosphatase [Bacillota bacterium]